MIPQKILVAFDGSEHSQKAFKYALEQAQAAKARLRVLSVAVPADPPIDVEMEDMLEEAEEYFKEDFKRLSAAAKEKGVELETDITVGHPAEQIVHRAQEWGADLIVLGHRGKNRLAEWLLGSISKRVTSYAPCSVTIVR
jgi:nucleotide-binding universal stress UspA family protein